MFSLFFFLCFFFFNDTATPEIYTLSLHDALPILPPLGDTMAQGLIWLRGPRLLTEPPTSHRDRKSTRLNSSHLGISYAVFCLKKKKKDNNKYDQYNIDNQHASTTDDPLRLRHRRY